MNKKGILTIILLICVIFSLQAVAAADGGSNSTDGNVLSVDNNVSSCTLPSSETGNLEVANEVSFTDLQTVVNRGGTGFANNNYTWRTGDSQVTISGTVTLDGLGKVIIDAKDQSRIFKIESGSSVTLKGITFINGNPASGPGGSVWASGEVHIDNCKFINNTVTSANGGAVYLSGFGSTITNSYFEGNRAIRNPTDVDVGSAGAVFLEGSNIAVTNSKFIKNSAGLNGGGIEIMGMDCYAYNCTFINNTASHHGGAAFLTSDYDSLNNNTGFQLCKFINNTAGYNGGAVDWAAGASNGYILDSTFTNNIAKRSGGAVHWSGHYGTIRNSTFNNNNATGDVISEIGGVTGGGDGGAVIWVGSHGIADNCTFDNNYAHYRGGAIFLHGNSTENCTNTTVSKSTFLNNLAGLNGGVIMLLVMLLHMIRVLLIILLKVVMVVLLYGQVQRVMYLSLLSLEILLLDMVVLYTCKAAVKVYVITLNLKIVHLPVILQI